MPRKLILIVFIVLAVLIVTGTVLAGGNKYGVADKREVKFDQPVWVADVRLPAGQYEVRHIMQGEEHMMIFRQLSVKTPTEATVKCNLIPLAKPAKQTEKELMPKAAGEYVLKALLFKGDRAEHRF